jgi:hypothetical protein
MYTDVKHCSVYTSNGTWIFTDSQQHVFTNNNDGGLDYWEVIFSVFKFFSAGGKITIPSRNQASP